ncbi:hypothetical protein ACFQQB_18660 [Nonomuraea rubra]|uniref:hypothetical protein n=1 Tax=Nonomuraea rubra TaxID=46180 RepID=UPI00361596F7
MISGARPSSPSTRLSSCTPAKVTSGSWTVPPTCPACRMPFSHSAGLRPSPEAGKEWFSVQESTSWYAFPDRICVVTLASRLRVQNVGEVLSLHCSPAAQLRSNGTSGQWAAVSLVSCAGSQVMVPLGRQRSATVNTTRAAGCPVNSSPER